MSVPCRIVKGVLPWLEDDEVLERIVGGHVGQCLRCQAERSRYRLLRRRLAELEAAVVAPPARTRRIPVGIVVPGAAAVGVAAVIGLAAARRRVGAA